MHKLLASISTSESLKALGREIFAVWPPWNLRISTPESGNAVTMKPLPFERSGRRYGDVLTRSSDRVERRPARGR
jgi:hypothetical protein